MADKAVDQLDPNPEKSLTEAAPTEEVQPNLDLQDLALALNVINVSIKRGTFETKELRGVLNVYEKIEAFLQFQAKVQAQKKEEEGDKE